MSQITSFGEDARGEIYIADRGGEIFKIIPQLTILEVSGPNAPGLSFSADDISWEDLQASSGHPVDSFKLYRSDSAQGLFTCIGEFAGNTAVGGDPTVPTPNGGLFFYLVTATDGSDESRPGNASDGTERDVDTGSSCS